MRREKPRRFPAAFSRRVAAGRGSGAAYAVVGLSQHGGTISVGGVKGGTYTDAVTGNTITVPDGGTIPFQVKGGSAGVYVLNGAGKVGVDGVYLR